MVKKRKLKIGIRWSEEDRPNFLFSIRYARRPKAIPVKSCIEIRKYEIHQPISRTVDRTIFEVLTNYLTAFIVIFVKTKASMPKLYEYFGLIFLFYSNEHEPIHVHGKFQDKESKAEIVFENGKFKEIIIKEVAGKEPLDAQNMKKFRKIVELYRDDIVRKWIDYFVYNLEIVPEKITRKV